MSPLANIIHHLLLVLCSVMSSAFGICVKQVSVKKVKTDPGLLFGLKKK